MARRLSHKYHDDTGLNSRSHSQLFPPQEELVQTKSMSEGISPRHKENIFVNEVTVCDKFYYKEQSFCTICYRGFSTTFRRHHCRVCANACCSDCSYGKINAERACDVCHFKYLNQGDHDRKTKLLGTMETLCGYLLYNKQMKMEEFERVKMAAREKNQQVYSRSKEAQQIQENSLKELENEGNSLVEKKKHLSNQLNLLVERNRKLQEELRFLENDMND